MIRVIGGEGERAVETEPASAGSKTTVTAPESFGRDQKRILPGVKLGCRGNEISQLERHYAIAENIELSGKRRADLRFHRNPATG